MFAIDHLKILQELELKLQKFEFNFSLNLTDLNLNQIFESSYKLFFLQRLRINCD